MGWGEDRGPARRTTTCLECGGDRHPVSVTSGSCPCGRFRIAGSDVAERLVDRYTDQVQALPGVVRSGDSLTVHTPPADLLGS